MDTRELGCVGIEQGHRKGSWPGLYNDTQTTDARSYAG